MFVALEMAPGQTDLKLKEHYCALTIITSEEKYQHGRESWSLVEDEWYVEQIENLGSAADATKLSYKASFEDLTLEVLPHLAWSTDCRYAVVYLFRQSAELELLKHTLGLGVSFCKRWLGGLFQWFGY